MAWSGKGQVHEGRIVLSEPLKWPEGTEVFVQVEPITANEQRAGLNEEDFTALPLFGMWADREDMEDSVKWVQGQRERRRQRAVRQD